MSRLKNKVAVIYGNSAVEVAIAKAFTREGAHNRINSGKTSKDCGRNIVLRRMG